MLGDITDTKYIVAIDKRYGYDFSDLYEGLTVVFDTYKSAAHFLVNYNFANDGFGWVLETKDHHTRILASICSVLYVKD